MATQTIHTANLGDLKPYPRNARTHSKHQIKQIADSINEFGWTVPILVDSAGVIIAGHARVEAAKLLGLHEVPTILVDHLNEAQKRAYIIADNKLSENADWDLEILAEEIEFLASVEFDLPVIGFETAEIDIIFQGRLSDEEATDEIPAIDESAPPVSTPGDLWLLGEHRLLCGDALERADYSVLTDGRLADMVFSDAPYNTPIHGHVCGRGKIRHSEFVMAGGEFSEAQFITFLTSAMALMVEFSTVDSVHFHCMDWRHLFEILTAGRSTYSAFLNLCVWAKSNGGMGSLYRSQHELVLVFRNGDGQHTNNVQLGRYGRNRTNLWRYPGVNIPTKEARDQLALHPTVKPVQLVADAILDVSKRGDNVLDPFCGSGTTILAAELTGRRALCLEIEPKYIDVAVRRFQDQTGIEPVHAETGKFFSEMAAIRSSQVGGEARHD